MNTVYTYLWEFEVAAGRVEEFVDAYGDDGAWVHLFRCASGYRGTRLLRDRERPTRFVTVDSWDTVEAYDAFRRQLAAEYETLDRACEGLAVRETLIGRFEG